VVEFVEVVKGITTEKAGDLLKATMEVKRERVACSEDGTSEANT